MARTIRSVQPVTADFFETHAQTNMTCEGCKATIENVYVGSEVTVTCPKCKTVNIYEFVITGETKGGY